MAHPADYFGHIQTGQGKMGIKSFITSEDTTYEPIENLEEIKKDMKFFKYLAKKNRHNRKIYILCLKIIDTFSKQIARVEKEGSIL